MFNRITSCAKGVGTVGSVTAFSFWEEQRRANEWKKNNPGKEYEMKHQSISGTAGCYYLVEKKSMDQQPSTPKMK